MKNSSTKNNIKRAVIEVNGGCNYSCQMCPQSVPGREKDFLKKMNINMFQDILNQLGYIECIQLEGSGEPTLNRDLPNYISIATKHANNVNIFTNGYKLNGNFMKECVDAGLTLARFSIIGYNKLTYIKMMDIDAFELVKENAIKMQEYIKKTFSKCVVGSYHLILDNNNIEYEIEQYKNNFIKPVGSAASIWKQHNWSGLYDNPTKRNGKKKTCGRPFAPELTIRAGGIDGKLGAIHPCCQALGRDTEATLGHVSENSIDEIWFGKKYEQLRKAHKDQRFDDISYCKDCDFLIDDPEVLVYNTNIDAGMYHMIGTTFDLNDYR